MKVLSKVTTCSIKCAVPILGIAVAAFFGGCKKDDPEPAPTKDIEIEFDQYSTSKIMPKNIQATLDSLDLKSIHYIYLVPVGTWYNLHETALVELRKNGLEPSMALSPKIKGKGDFNFYPGDASRHPQDSLWYVENGWTINKHFMENR